MAGKNALRRYRIIDLRLRNNMRGSPSRKDLLEALWDEGIEITAAQLDKDIKYLKDEEGAPIVFDRQKNGYRYTDPGYAYAKNTVSESDKWILDFANASIGMYGFPIEEEFQKLSSKWANGSAADKIDVKNLSKYLIPDISTTDNGYQYLYGLYRAIIERKVFQIKYHPFNKEPRIHVISPYLLRQYGNRWYLIGFSKKIEKTLVFALDRIREMKPSRQEYKQDPNFDPESYFKYSFGITHKYDEKPQQVRLQFGKDQKDYILSLPLHPSQRVVEQDENLVVEMEVIISQELTMKILSYGDGVKVLGPARLVEAVKESLKQALDIYS